MGVHVGYADINYTSMLIEVARPVGGFVPEVSFGSHFFQDLVESRIRYLALSRRAGQRLQRTVLTRVRQRAE